MENSKQTYQGAVYPWHCDQMGHMNVMYYVGKFDEATWHFFSSIGLRASEMRDGKEGLVAVEQNIKYKAELFAGDIITIHSKIVEYGDKSLKFKHEMRNSETDVVVATTILTGLYFDKVTRKAINLPRHITEKLQKMMAQKNMA